MEALGLIVAFIGGVLVDHFFFNKIAGYVSEAEADAKARLAAIEASLGLHVREINIADSTPLAPTDPPKG